MDAYEMQDGVRDRVLRVHKNTPTISSRAARPWSPMSKTPLSTATRVAALLACTLVFFTIGCASGGAGKAPAAPPVVGTWNLVLETPMGKQEPTFIVTQTDGALSGKFTSPQGEVEVPAITDTDGVITFDMNIDAAGQQLLLKFSGTVDGDNMTGKFGSDFGDMPVTGTRAVQ